MSLNEDRSPAGPDSSDVLDAEAGRVFDAFLADLEAGRPADPARLLDDHPHLADRLRTCLKFMDWADDAVAVGPRQGAWTRTLSTVVETANDAPAPSAAGLADSTGATIGPYTLLERIGEGGMGVVYRAEQTRPVRRQVALKVIKPGTDTAQLLARFERERQALAQMDHPNIAHVVDVGTTDASRPYFVMELVAGAPITTYCDNARLTTRERLQLFLPVCHAIQHAHQKGVIHRDIKPSNVLVATVERKPVVKVIDFGVAKPIDAAEDSTLVTRHDAIVGTPQYMSPEQAGLDGADIDSRTDVYSLGVLLYELLTGTTPLEHERVRCAAHSEVLRRVRDEDPPRPSDRLSASRDRLGALAPQRRSDPGRLVGEVRGELDWIVMKALEKDRSRRYETADGLARDVERYLAFEPIDAGPPSASYKLRKLARKHRAALAVVLTVAVLLVGAALGGTYLAVRASNAERLANQRLIAVRTANNATSAALTRVTNAQSETAEALERARFVSQFLVDAFRSPDPGRDGYQVKVAEVLDQATKRLDEQSQGSPAARADLLEAIGQTYRALSLQEKATTVFEKTLAVRDAALGPDHPDTRRMLHVLAGAYQSSGRSRDAVPVLERLSKQERERLGSDHPDVLKIGNTLGLAYVQCRRPQEGAALLEATLKTAEATLPPDDRLRWYLCSNLINAYTALAGDPSGGRTAQTRAALEISETRLGPDHPVSAHFRERLATIAAGRPSPERVVAEYEMLVRDNETRLGPDHALTLQSLDRLAEAYHQAGRPEDAAGARARILTRVEAKLGRNHSDTLRSREALAFAYRDGRRFADAVATLEPTVAFYESKFGPNSVEALNGRKNLASAYQEAGRAAEAVSLREQVFKFAQARFGPWHFETRQARRSLADAYHAANRHREEIAVAEDAVAQQRASWGPAHLHTLKATEDLSHKYVLHGRAAEAIQLLATALEASEAASGPDHGNSEELRLGLAYTLMFAGRAEEGLGILETALRRKRSRLGADHADVLRDQGRLGIAALQYGHVVDGLQLMEDVRTRGAGRSDVRDALQWVLKELGPYYERVGRLASAEAVYRDNLAMTAASHGPDSGIVWESPPGAVATDSDLLGQNLLKQGKWSEAEVLLRTALTAREKSQPDACDMYYNRSTLGESLLGQARYAEAETLILSGYDGLKAREAMMNSIERRTRLTEAALRVVKLYRQWGKIDRVAACEMEFGLMDLPSEVFTPVLSRSSSR